MSGSAGIWRRQAHGVVVIARKNALLYYLKPPVLIFGVLFPVFFFLAFTMGRDVPSADIVPGMVAMALWFTGSAVGPLVTPWERAAKTYERLISSPLSLGTIVLGDVISGFLFGSAFTMLPIVLGLGFTQASVGSWILLIAGVLLGALTFSALGVLLASPPVSGPSHIMMLSNLIRLPLLFVSGIFVPLSGMPRWVRWLAPISPLSYTGDLIRRGFGQPGYFPLALDFLMLAIFAVAMFWGACAFHRRWRAKGL
jgi:ABC-2 type transport system permease protein